MQVHHRRPALGQRGKTGPGRRRSRPHLRAVISNGDFEEYRQFHLKREHQRIYPGVKQEQYALGA